MAKQIFFVIFGALAIAGATFFILKMTIKKEKKTETSPAAPAANAQ